jgi:hypothetical protein
LAIGGGAFLAVASAGIGALLGDMAVGPPPERALEPRTRIRIAFGSILLTRLLSCRQQGREVPMFAGVRVPPPDVATSALSISVVRRNHFVQEVRKRSVGVQIGGTDRILSF